VIETNPGEHLETIGYSGREPKAIFHPNRLAEASDWSDSRRLEVGAGQRDLGGEAV
jgi:hypothetical protein